MYSIITDLLSSHQNVILDGGTGTDIQRRGVPMDGDSWCAEANRTHPEVVQAVHEAYISAGSHIITANTFASSVFIFNALGRDDDVLEMDAVAVQIAKKATLGKNVCIAGSISTMRPVVPNSDRNDLSKSWSEEQARALFQRKASNLCEHGVDLILMEMMRDTDTAVWATQAALSTGLPVWVGISAERREDGQLCGFSRPDCLIEDIIIKLAALRPAVMNIMHTSANLVVDTIAILRRHWAGPIGVYPDSGYFEMPSWVFADVIPVPVLVEHCKRWRTLGVNIFGGCCGLGPRHIEALSTTFCQSSTVAERGGEGDGEGKGDGDGGERPSGGV